jgi:AraC-like DNA-binding protein
MEYLNNVRINKSKDLLMKNPDLRIKDVSVRSGYDSTSYFCSIFRRMEGMSPGKFRELHLYQKYLQPE